MYTKSDKKSPQLYFKRAVLKAHITCDLLKQQIPPPQKLKNLSFKLTCLLLLYSFQLIYTYMMLQIDK